MKAHEEEVYRKLTTIPEDVKKRVLATAKEQHSRRHRERFAKLRAAFNKRDREIAGVREAWRRYMVGTPELRPVLEAIREARASRKKPELQLQKLNPPPPQKPFLKLGSVDAYASPLYLQTDTWIMYGDTSDTPLITVNDPTGAGSPVADPTGNLSILLEPSNALGIKTPVAAVAPYALLGQIFQTPDDSNLSGLVSLASYPTYTYSAMWYANCQYEVQWYLGLNIGLWLYNEAGTEIIGAVGADNELFGSEQVTITEAWQDTSVPLPSQPAPQFPLTTSLNASPNQLVYCWVELMGYAQEVLNESSVSLKASVNVPWIHYVAP